MPSEAMIRFDTSHDMIKKDEESPIRLLKDSI